MKTLIYRFKNFTMLLLSLLAVGTFSSCGDDDPDIDPDQPVILPAEGLTVKGGQSVLIEFDVIAPGSIADISIETSAGDATLNNREELIGTTRGLAEVNYAPAKEVNGTQTVTLRITDQSGKNSSNAADIEVFAPIAFGMAIVSGAGDVNTTFLQGLIDMDVSTVNNSNSTELGQFAAIYSDGNSLFTVGFGAPATMGKYVFNSAGEAKLDQEIIVPGSNSFSTVEIIDQNTAYATVGGGLSRAVQFSPSEMRITGEIDLSDAGDGLFYSDMIIRDNILFIALNDFGGSGVAKIAVVDLQNNTLVKVITDDRTATLFNTLTSAIMIKDNNGDIYVQGSGLFSAKTSGILRIKAGETEFDPAYFFDLGATTGKSCFGLYHFGGDHTFTTISEDDGNWFGTDGANPSFRYRKIDLVAKTDEGDLDATVPNTFAASRTMFMVQTTDSEILFPIAGKDEDALYSYDMTTGAVSKKIVSSSGYVSGLVPLF